MEGNNVDMELELGAADSDDIDLADFDLGGEGEQPKAPTKPKKQQKGKGISPANKKKKRPEKDPNAPKRGRSAYVFFSAAKRAAVKESQPELGFGEVATELGRLWKAAGEEEKRPFEEAAAKDKLRYEEEMKSYTPPPGFDSQGKSKDATKTSKVKVKPTKSKVKATKSKSRGPLKNHLRKPRTKCRRQ